MLLQGVCAATGMHLRPGSETSSSPKEGAARREAAIARCPPPTGLPGLPSINRLVLHFVNKIVKDLPGRKCCSGNREKGEKPAPTHPQLKAVHFFFLIMELFYLLLTAASHTGLTILCLCLSVARGSGRLFHVPGQVAHQDLSTHVCCANMLCYAVLPTRLWVSLTLPN